MSDKSKDNPIAPQDATKKNAGFEAAIDFDPDTDLPEDDMGEEFDEHPHSGLRGVIMAAAFVAVLVGGGYATTDLWLPVAAPYLPTFAQGWLRSNEIEAPANLNGELTFAADAKPPKMVELQSQREKLKPEIDGLLDRVQSLESALNDLREAAKLVTPQTVKSDRAGEFQALSDRLARLEGLSIEGGMPEAQALNRLVQRVARLESEGKLVGFGEEIGKLSERLDQLEVENGDSQASSRSIPAVVLAVGQLRGVVLDSQAFDAELESVKRFGGDDPVLDQPLATLARFQTTGIPSLVMLRSSFDSHQDAIIRAGLANTGTDWLDQTLARVGSVVSVRRTGEDLSGDGVDAVVARAEAALAIGDVAGAVGMIGALEATAVQAAKPWLTLATERLAAEKALAALHRYAISLIAERR